MTQLIVGVDGAPLSVPRTGVGRYVAEILKASQRRYAHSIQFQTLLYHPGRRRRSEPVDDLLDAGISIRRLPYLISRGLTAGIGLGLPVPYSLALGQHDVALFTRYWHSGSRRRPSLSILYDLVFDVAPETVQPGYLERLRRAARGSIERSTGIVTISETVESELHARYPTTVGRTFVVPPAPTELPALPPGTSGQALKELGLERGYVIHVGTIEPRKNLLPLLKAYEALPHKLSATHPLVLVGGSGWSNSDVVAAMEHLGHRVRHVPYVSDPVLRTLVEGAALLVSSSTYEGYGLPLIEAMHLRVPVACSDIPVFHEVCGTAAAFFDHRDSSDIAGVVADLLESDALRDRLRIAGLHRVRQLTWESSAGALVAALSEVSAG